MNRTHLKALSQASLMWGALVLTLPATAQTRLDETHPAAANARVSVENVKGSIRIVGTDGGELRLRGELGKDAELVLNADDPERISIEIEYPNSSGWGWGGGSGGDTDLEIELPRGVQLEVESVSASIDLRGLSGDRVKAGSVSGDITLSESSPKRLAMESVSGALRARGDIVEIDLESVSGSIEIDATQTRSLRAEAVSGGVELSLADPLDELRVSTVSGRVRVTAGPSQRGQFRIETLSGGLRLELPAATSARLTAESFSGRIRSPVGEVEREEFGPGSSLDTTLGGGEARVRLETFSGALDISLQQAR